jgi:glycosyltransferase involved in cell wall biosynthesis
MNALVISPQPFFTPRGTPFSVYYRTLVVAELGVKVDLLTYGEGQDIDIPGVRIIRIPRFSFLGSVKVGPSLLKLFLDAFMLIWTVGLLLRNRYDFVHAHEESVFFCRFLKMIFRYKLIYDMHSSLPQQLTNFKFTNSRFLIGLFKKLEDSCLHAADVVITICPDLADYVNNMIQKNGKHLLIENSIFEPVKLVQKSPSISARNVSCSDLTEMPLDLYAGKLLIVYAGTLEPYQGIDILIRAFKKVIKTIPDAFLFIIGGNPNQVNFYLNLAQTFSLEGHVRLTGRVPQHLAQHYCRLASVLVSPRSEGTNTPLKVYEQLASGIPLVATNIYSHTQVLNDDVAILVAPDPHDMAVGLIRALNTDSYSSRVARNARDLYKKKYSRPVYVDKMREVLKLLS